ncbi:ubinuclein-1-like isoform X2 [Curcuma longa]|uniref:ubinuclein-1-like isoform X2 n=1 Tax=Curcuma longa TaxID=136217 RepID=UPI003D9E56D3
MDREAPSAAHAAASPAAPPPLPPPAEVKRLRFTVDLKPDKTTTVSWTRLLESGQGVGASLNAAATHRPVAAKAGADCKRNIREMVASGPLAKQQTADRFQQIKKEVNEIIRAHFSQPNSKEISNDGARSLKEKFVMSTVLEDKMYDLYDLYVEGVVKDKGPHCRKLYVELAELWPSGYMDNVRIKDAIYRAKERRSRLYRQHKARSAEKSKRQKLASTTGAEKLNPIAQVLTGREKASISRRYH